MSDPFETKRRWKGWDRLMSLDSWVDDFMYRQGASSSEWWENVTIFFRRFRVYGWKKLGVEAACEALTVGVAGALLVLALGKPAYDMVESDWRARKEYSMRFLDRFGNEIGRRGDLHSEAVPVDQLPEHFVKAVLSTEDRRFFEHIGLDFFGLARAIVENAKASGVVQGGSTITQQLAKNVFLTNERSLDRKIKEAYLSLWLEWNLSKKEILKLYLDRAYMGGPAHGVAAASQFYFGKSIRDVSLAEAAMLAGLFKAPSKYAPHRNLPAARARANEVLTNLVQAGFMSEGQVVEARRRPATTVPRTEVESPDYFLDWAFGEAKEIARGFPTNSLVVRTTVDPGLQAIAEESIEQQLLQNGEAFDVEQGSMVVIEHGGAVRAVVGGRDYGESQYNRATQARRQPGSAFKPFVFATAMENGFSADSKVSGKNFCIKNWCPKNYNDQRFGNVNLAFALIKSVNTVPIRLGLSLGRKPIVETAQAMGITSPMQYGPAMVLGTNDMTALELATAYGVFMEGGMETGTYGITSISDTQGEVLYDHRRDRPEPKRVLSEHAVREMNSILVQIPEWGTGRRAKIPGLKTAGKTGTTQSYRDAWFVGYTGNFSAAVWFGNDAYNRPTNKMTGGSLPAMTFQRFMTYAHENIAIRDIPFVEPEPGGPQAPPPPAEGEEGLTLAVRQQPLLPETAAVLRRLEDALRIAPPLAPTPLVTAAKPADTPTVGDAPTLAAATTVGARDVGPAD